MKGKNMQVRFVILVVLIISLLAGCQSDDAPKAETAGQIIGHKIEVKEVIQSASYTYLRVKENGNEYWIATGKRDFDEGATLYYDQGLEMKKSYTLWNAYNSILKDFLPIIDFTMEAVRVYAKIQADSVKTGKTRPVFDLLIASTAIANNLILATCNYKNFKDIPGLKVEDWLIPFYTSFVPH